MEGRYEEMESSTLKEASWDGEMSQATAGQSSKVGSIYSQAPVGNQSPASKPQKPGTFLLFLCLWSNLMASTGANRSTV